VRVKPESPVYEVKRAGGELRALARALGGWFICVRPRRLRQIQGCARALQTIPATKPDVAIVDISTKHDSGMELIKNIRRLHDKTVILKSLFFHLRLPDCAYKSTNFIMKKLTNLPCVLLGIGLLAGNAFAQSDAPYKVLDTTQLMGNGGIDYVYADNDERRVYVPRGTNTFVFDLDTHKYIGAITNISGHGVAVDTATHHGFSSSAKIGMFDTETMQKIKSIDVQGRPDGILLEPFTDKIYIFSHQSPSITVIDPKDGSVVGTIDVGGAMEEARSGRVRKWRCRHSLPSEPDVRLSPHPAQAAPKPRVSGAGFTTVLIPACGA
jgi:CheY-like chemotaxis protein